MALTPEDLSLLEEAMQLLETDNPADALRVALRELIERQRFLNWVASHEHQQGKHRGAA